MAFLGYDRYSSGADEIGLNAKEAGKPTTEQLRAFIDNEIATADENVNRKKAADEFVKVYKEFGYIDSKANGALIRHELQARGHWHNPTITNFEEAFVALNESGLLALDQKKIQAEQARLLDARAAEIRENTFSLEKAEAMSTEELYQRGMGFKG
jgi:hypothetical protein